MYHMHAESTSAPHVHTANLKKIVRSCAMVRLTAFPVLFGATLLTFAVGFLNRRKFFRDVEEIQREKATEGHYQAIEIKSKVGEKVRKEREGKNTSN